MVARILAMILSPIAVNCISVQSENFAACGLERVEKMIIVSFAEWQDQCALEVEALPDDEAKEAYGALVSIVHQMARQEAGLGMAVALDEIEVFARSFEAYVDHLDELDPKKLETHYEIMRGSAINEANPPKLRFGAQALMVIIVGEMIRRGGVTRNEHDMSGYDRALRMLNRLERSLESK
jgi:hypothetical protein